MKTKLLNQNLNLKINTDRYFDLFTYCKVNNLLKGLQENIYVIRDSDSIEKYVKYPNLLRISESSNDKLLIDAEKDFIIPTSFYDFRRFDLDALGLYYFSYQSLLFNNWCIIIIDYLPENGLLFLFHTCTGEQAINIKDELISFGFSYLSALNGSTSFRQDLINNNCKPIYNDNYQYFF